MEWLRTAHSELDASKSYAAMSSFGYSTNPASWTSEEDDTASESEQSFYSFDCRRKKPCALRFKTRALSQPAAPVAIPARTHDFGWCDRDDARTESPTCPCGNDCADFFGDDAHSAPHGAAPWASSATEAPREEAEDEFMFDMEM